MRVGPEPRRHASRLRAAIVAPGFHAGEGDPFVPYWRDHVAALAAHHDLTVVPLRYPASRRPYRVHGAEVVPLGRGDVRLRASPALWRDAVAAVVAYHRRAPFDVVHALQAGEAGFVAALAAASIRRPLVAHVAGGELVRLRDVGYGAGTSFERLAASTTLRAARVVTCGSRAMQALARRRMHGRRGAVRLAPLGIRAERFRQLPRPVSGLPVEILCVANLNPVKDHQTLLAAFAALEPGRRGARLSLVGFGPRAGALRVLARRLGVAAHVRWWGAVPHGAIHVAFARAAAYASASRHEAQGIAALEAAATGLALAVTPVGAMADLASPTLHPAPVRDPRALALAMEAALADGPAVGDGLAAEVAARYGLEACTARFLDAYRAAVAR